MIVCLGAFAWEAACRLYGIKPRPKFGHGAEHEPAGGGPVLLGCFHLSQQNTFTGKLTEPMTDAVFLRARELAGYEEVRLAPAVCRPHDQPQRRRARRRVGTDGQRTSVAAVVADAGPASGSPLRASSAATRAGPSAAASPRACACGKQCGGGGCAGRPARTLRRRVPAVSPRGRVSRDAAGRCRPGRRGNGPSASHAAPELQADRGARPALATARESHCFPAWRAGSRPQ